MALDPEMQGVPAPIVIQIPILRNEPVIDRRRVAADPVLCVAGNVHVGNIAAGFGAVVIQIAGQADAGWLELERVIQRGCLRRPVAYRDIGMK